jgi:hypothetical protein
MNWNWNFARYGGYDYTFQKVNYGILNSYSSNGRRNYCRKIQE